MNNKGQTLVIFVMLLPLFLCLLAYITDTSYLFYEKNKLDDVNKMVINYKMNHIEANKEKVKNYIMKNGETIKIEKMDMNDKSVTIKLSKKVKSIFGSIVGKNYYDITSYYRGTIDTKRIGKIKE